MVKVVDVCVGCAASGYSEGCVLNCLKFFCVGGRGDGGPDGAGIFECWTGYCFVGGGDGFFVFAPVCGGECFQ